MKEQPWKPEPGREITSLRSEGRPEAKHGPLCPVCFRRIGKWRGGRTVNGQPAHFECAARSDALWSHDRKVQFVEDYNAKVPIPTLLSRYDLTRNKLWHVTKGLKAQGFLLKRLNNGNQWSPKQTPESRKRHEMAMAGIKA